MTVLLLLATFALFLGIDYVRKMKRVPEMMETTAASSDNASVPQLRSDYVAGFALPEHFRYHPGHTWAMQETPALVRVGLDDFAAKLAEKSTACICQSVGSGSARDKNSRRSCGTARWRSW